MYYTGIGSRKTPHNILIKMTEVAKLLSNLTLRSGGAQGADQAFAIGAEKKDLFYPWPNFNPMPSKLDFPSFDAMNMASKIHPVWNSLSPAAKKLHARNCHQVLGESLDVPSLFILYWTPKGEFVGGTRTALILGQQNNIPCIFIEDTEKLNIIIEKYK